jgi:Tfp pilus assembly protein PilF
MKRMTSCLVGVAVTVLAGAGTIVSGAGIDPAELLSGAALGIDGPPPSDLVTEAEVLAVSPEMEAFVREHVNPGATDVFKLQQLIDALMGSGTFGLEYDVVTHTASETFRTRRGNCLSFSTMFVALARLADLDAEFEEVEIPPDWSMANRIFVLNQHVNVAVDLGAAGVHVVDFNISDFKSTYDIRRIRDRRAVAHFFNNLGVERMQAGDTAAAMALLRRAVESDRRDFSPAWTNLGTLYRKAGLLDHAEACFLRALRADRYDTVAMSNLVGLYEKIGRTGEADEYRKRVREHRMRNPYYRFRLARDAFFERDYETAIDHLKHAIRRQDRDDQFFFLLGLCHLMDGREEEAKRWMARAEELASNPDAKRRYSTKIDALMAASEGVD